VADAENEIKPVSISEVKQVLKKVEKEREELLYEQKIALEHATKFARINVKKTNDMLKELLKLDFIKENQAYKIADILPNNEDDVRTIFAKERVTIGESEIKKILEIVKKYYIE
jgi:DNA-directed RNA polymerase subunit F